MTITLTADQEASLKDLVATGDFASIEEAARALLDERLAERRFDGDDCAWAKPFIDEAEADVARGAVISREEHDVSIKAFLASMR
jgi:antitoxin ParD1/3/4